MTKRATPVWLRPTTRVERALQDAQQHARSAGYRLAQSGHLLVALVQEPRSFSTLLLGRLGVSPDALRDEIKRIEAQADRSRPAPDQTAALAPGVRPTPQQYRRLAEMEPTEAAWADNRGQMLDAARQEAQALGDKYVGTEHLLLALIHSEGVCGSALRNLGVTREAAQSSLAELKSAEAAPAVG